MASSVLSPEDVVNIALTKAGSKVRISNLYDGSQAAKKALDIYGQSRDNVLRMKSWGFAERIAALVVTGSAAPFPWLAEFTYPTDCIKIREIFGPTYQADPNNPLPLRYTVANDGAAKVIWAKVATGTLVYTAQITNPALWDDPDFVDVLVGALAVQLAKVMSGLEAAKMASDEAMAALKMSGEEADE